MQKFDLNDLVEFNSSRFNPKVLVNEPDYRMVLLSLLAGQEVPEHAAPARVTIYALRGRVTFYEEDAVTELKAGELIGFAAGAKHRVVAHEDSALLALATGSRTVEKLPVDISEELDLREVARPLRHPMIFARFDALAPGASIRLLNDHDPIPLNRQFDTIRTGQALWEYIQRGPELFRIRITRVAPSSPSDTPVGSSNQPIQLQSSKA